MYRGGIYIFDEHLNLSQLFSILFTEIKRGCLRYLKWVKKYQPTPVQGVFFYLNTYKQIDYCEGQDLQRNNDLDPI